MDDFVIDKSFRFDGDKNLSDQVVLHAISAGKYNVKGLMENSYGRKGENSTNKILENQKTH